MQENNIPVKIMELEDNHPKIHVNGKLKLRKDTVKKNDKIHFFVNNESYDEKIVPESMELDIVYEDPYLLVLNKPANMQMMISKAHPKGTLANGINHYYREQGIQAKIHFVTKLDREASGLIVVAKHKFINYLLTSLEPNLITYHLRAIVEGRLDLKESCIPLPIARLEGSIKREVSEEGIDCATNYKVAREFKDSSLVDIWVNNKLAHQIRVHFSFFFCPIVGDKVYGHASDTELMLYCNKILFDHPITEEPISLEISEPSYFKKILEGK